jgi:putative transport protein
MTFVVDALRNHPELAIFLTVALGFLVGRLKIGSFTLGSVVGTLLAGVLIGQLDIQVPGVVKTVFFDLFLFATGYKVGPQFFRGLKKNALSQVALTVVLCVTCLITAFTAAKVLHYDRGTAAGLLAGAFTESTVIGTAADAINRLDIPAEQKAAETNNIPVAYAVTYLVGTAFVVWFLSNLAPRLIKVNLKEESRKLAALSGAGATVGEAAESAYRPWQFRAYKVQAPGLWGKTVADIEGLFRGERAFIERIRRGSEILEAAPGTVVFEGDVIALMAPREPILTAADLVGPEEEDRELLDVPASVLDVVVTNRTLVDHTLAEAARLQGRGIALRSLVRGGEEMPFTADTTINRGDILQVMGSVANVERVAKVLGYAERGTSATDMIFVGTGIVLGGLMGLLSVTVWGLPLTLTSSGGALVMGLVFGWLRSVRPTFGRIPEPALWIFDTLGLVVFIGIVGLNAGPSFISGLQKTGISLVFVGLLVAVTPHVAAILFGKYVLKMNPVILLGACSGAGTNTAALRAIEDEAHSKLPALGYTVPYAVGNILLTAWGPVIVAMLSA